MIRAGVRWRDVGSEQFTWGDCLALVEYLDWDDPLSRAMSPKDWAWNDPSRDLLVTVIEVLGQINAKTPLAHKQKKGDLPKRIPRPWDKSKNVQKLGSKPRPLAEIDEWMTKRLAGA